MVGLIPTETRKRIIAAYEAAEKAAGGLAKADVQSCLRGAARSADVDEDVARSALIDHWSGMRG